MREGISTHIPAFPAQVFILAITSRVIAIAAALSSAPGLFSTVS